MLDELKEPLDEYQNEAAQKPAQDDEETLHNLQDDLAGCEKLESKLIKHKKHEAELHQLQDKMEALRTEIKRLQDAAAVREDLELMIWFRCLTIIELMLENAASIRPSTQSKILVLILPAIQHAMPGVRLLGFKCLGMICLSDQNLAHMHLHLCLKAMEQDCEEVQACLLKILFDLLIYYRTDLFPAANDKAYDSNVKDVASLICHLKQYLQDPNSDNRTVAVEGFCKLFISGLVDDAEVRISIIIFIH